MPTSDAELCVVGTGLAGAVILIVPPPLRTPDGYVPCAAELLGAKNAHTGQLLPGVTAIRLTTDMDETTGDLAREVTAKLTEYVRVDGQPVRTLGDLNACLREAGGMEAMPRAAFREHQVVGRA